MRYDNLGAFVSVPILEYNSIIPRTTDRRVRPTSSEASKRGMASVMRSLSRLEAWLLSSPKRSATALTSSIVPATLRHVLCFSAGLLSLYSRKCVSSCPSTSQYLRLSPSRPHGCTDRGWLRSSSCRCCLYESFKMAWTVSEEQSAQMMSVLRRVS